MKTTPQTWYEAKPASHQGLVCCDQTGKNIAVTYDKADAALIAAAPELLAACVELVEHVESCRQSWESDGATYNTKLHGLAVSLNNRAGDLIRAAIAKAKGQQ